MWIGEEAVERGLVGAASGAGIGEGRKAGGASKARRAPSLSALSEGLA